MVSVGVLPTLFPMLIDAPSSVNSAMASVELQPATIYTALLPL